MKLKSSPTKLCQVKQHGGGETGHPLQDPSHFRVQHDQPDKSGDADNTITCSRDMTVAPKKIRIEWKTKSLIIANTQDHQVLGGGLNER